MGEYNELYHHGIKGQKWGVRRTPAQLGRHRVVSEHEKILRKSFNRNLDKWGDSAETNVLYITGRSGSGKSTAALAIADKYKKCRVVHLDTYFDDRNGKRDLQMDAYMKEHLPEYKMLNAPKDKISLKDWGKICEKFEVELENYGTYQHQKGNRVIVEGVELLDDTIRPDKTYFRDKPIAILKTNPVVSERRGMKRDGMKVNKENIRNAISNNRMWSEDIRKFEEALK